MRGTLIYEVQERIEKMKYCIDESDIENIIFDVLLGGVGDTYDGIRLLDEYEEQLEWLYHTPKDIINSIKYSTGDVEGLNNYDDFKHDMIARIESEWIDQVERRLKQAMRRYNLDKCH